MKTISYIFILILGLCVLPYGSPEPKGRGQKIPSSTGPHNPNPRQSPLGRYARHVGIYESPIQDKLVHSKLPCKGRNCQPFNNNKPFPRRFTRDLTTKSPGIKQDLKTDHLQSNNKCKPNGKPPCPLTQPFIDYKPSGSVFTQKPEQRNKRSPLVRNENINPCHYIKGKPCYFPNSRGEEEALLP